MTTLGPIQISQITAIVSALALLWLAAVVPLGMALLWRAHRRLVRQQTAAIVKAVRGVSLTVYNQNKDDSFEKFTAILGDAVGPVSYPDRPTPKVKHGDSA